MSEELDSKDVENWIAERAYLMPLSGVCALEITLRRASSSNVIVSCCMAVLYRIQFRNCTAIMTARL